MPQITEGDFPDSPTTLSILDQGLHGGFIEREGLREEESDFCEQANWVEKVIRFRCSACENWHTAPAGERRCSRTQQPAESLEEKEGYRVVAESQLNLNIGGDYNLFVEESSSSIDIARLPHKSIVFVPDESEMVFSDRAGSTVVLPLEELPKIMNEEKREEIIEDINAKRRQLVDWDRLDSKGGDFERIVFRLIKRDSDYFNESWGGSGPDQGKDGFCSIDLGGRDKRILEQAKFNNEGSAINDKQVEKSCRKAERHDCSGVIIAAIRTSGDLETEYESGSLQSRSANFLRIWSGPEIKEMLSEHPDLIAEMFLQ
jgi:hypothetical protein